LLAVGVLQTFPDINFTDSAGYTPPDTMMAVGPTTVVGAVNTAIVLKDKAGNTLDAPQDFSTFFSSIYQSGNGFSDPQVMYDDQAQRYYVCILEIPNNQNSTYLDFAVSKSSKPTDLSSANWTVFSHIASVNEGGSQFPDFPKMGWNNDAVFVSFNQFPNSTSFSHNLILSISKASILSGGSLSTFQTVVQTNDPRRILIPARMHGSAPGTEYFVQTDDGKSTVNVIAETGYLTASPSFATTKITVNPYTDSPGVPGLTYAIDDRMLSADWVNNKLVAAGNVGEGGLNLARWYEFNTSGTPVLVQQGDISAGPGVSTSYPSVAINPTGDMGMTFIQSSATQPYSMYITGRLAIDPLGSMEPAIEVAPGVLPVPTDLRGGDYSATEYDPADPSQFWSANEFNSDSSGNNFDWGTQIANYTISPVTVSGVTIPVTQVGKPLTNIEVATFTDKPTLFPINQYTAIVDWGDGTTPDMGTIVDLKNGSYAVMDSHTYTAVGNYLLKVTVTNPNGKSGSATDPVSIIDSPITPISTTINATAGQAFNGLVGSFSDSNLLAVPGDFTATINWGDGHVSKGTVAAAGTDGSGNLLFNVTGSNTYFNYGAYTVSVAIVSKGGATGTINSPANVSDAPITPINRTFGGIEGSTINAVVASFTSGNSRAVSGNFSAQIDWGDGSPITTFGYTISNRGTRFDISATHTYKEFGVYPVTVKILSAGGTSATANSTATFTDAPVNSTTIPIATTIGVPFSGVIANITDGDTFGLTSDFAASTIDWGDGTAPTLAVITTTGSGQFNISGSHTYALYGSFPVTIQVVDRGGNTTPVVVQATVNDSTITSQGLLVNGSAGTPFTGSVATFIDSYPAAPLGQFTATIDWGDGSVPTQGTITQPGGVGTFFVGGSHTYSNAQSDPISVTISDPGGASSTANSTIVVADPPLTGSPLVIPPPVHEGSVFTGNVAAFTTPNTVAGPSNYIAQINWGDGTTSQGAVSQSSVPGSFLVSTLTPHTFGPAANYQITTTIISLGGSRTTVVDPTLVLDAPISAVSSAPISTVAGTTFSGTVVNFSQYNLTPAADFTATINWGDGSTPTSGTVVANANGTFSVRGSHLYTANGTFNTAISISSVGGAKNTLGNKAVVGDAALTSTAGTVGTVVNVPFNGTVATFHDANFYALAGEFKTIINWGDGTPLQAGVVQGSAGTFQVLASHTYTSRESALPFSVTIVHFGPQGGGNLTSTVGTARVLAQLTGGMSSASDTGFSNSDGITNITTPVFSGTGQPGAAVALYATAAGSTSPVLDAVAYVNNLGNWAVQINPLTAGTYAMTASMIDSVTGATVNTIPLKVTPGGSSILTVSTTGPTVTGTVFNPAAGQLIVAFHDASGGMSPAGLNNAANFQVAVPVGNGLQQLTPTGLKVAYGAGGVAVVTVNYNLGRTRSSAYVVTLNSTNLTNLAGNILNEQHFVTFPQINNTPNPNYVAQFVVSRNGAVTGPLPYVSKAEQIAASKYSGLAQGIKARGFVAQATITSTIPRPSRVRKK
jgi:hypothetical protein